MISGHQSTYNAYNCSLFKDDVKTVIYQLAYKHIKTKITELLLYQPGNILLLKFCLNCLNVLLNIK